MVNVVAPALGQNAGVRTQILDTTDAFVVFDLDDAATSAGVTRLAPKVLRDGAELLARSTTYAFASFGLRFGGASAGINAKPDGRDAAVAAFVAEVQPLVEAGTLSTRPGLGLTLADLASLRGEAGGPIATWMDDPLDLSVRGAIAAATAMVGALADARVGVVGAGPMVEATTEAARALGATIHGEGRGPDGGGGGAPGSDTDVLFVAGRAGVVDHEAAEHLRTRAVVALTPAPVTARAFAVLTRAGTVYVPDFLSTAAPVLASFDPAGGDPVERVGAAVATVAAEGTGAWSAAVRRAEAFLSTWQDRLPFGRPLA